MKNIALSYLLLILISGIVLVSSLTVGTNIYVLSSTDNLTESSQGEMTLTRTLESSMGYLHLSRIALHRASAATSLNMMPLRDQEMARVKALLALSDQHYDQFRTYDSDPASDALEDALKTARTRLIQGAIAPALEALSHGDVRSADRSVLLGDDYDKALVDAVHSIFALRAQKQQALYAASHHHVQFSFYMMLLCCLAGTSLCLIMFLGTRKLIIQPLQVVRRYFRNMAQGNLSDDIEDHGRNEIGALFTTLKDMQYQLSHIVGQVREGGLSLHQHAVSLTQGNTDVSNAIAQQAISLENVTGSLESLTHTVRQNADHAEQVGRLTKQSTDIVNRGGDEMQNVTRTMNSIAQSTEEIASIISMIDSIAFQTNLLALNASVEAARAGEHGSGFAVVASEVRHLAIRSAASADAIKQLIDSVTERVRRGHETAEIAGKTINEMVSSIHQVNRLVVDIAKASKAQSTGLEQVNRTVIEIDSATQQNAARVAQFKGATFALEQQAASMREQVARFKLSLSHRTHVA